MAKSVHSTSNNISGDTNMAPGTRSTVSTASTVSAASTTSGRRPRRQGDGHLCNKMAMLTYSGLSKGALTKEGIVSFIQDRAKESAAAKELIEWSIGREPHEDPTKEHFHVYVKFKGRPAWKWGNGTPCALNIPYGDGKVAVCRVDEHKEEERGNVQSGKRKRSSASSAKDIAGYAAVLNMYAPLLARSTPTRRRRRAHPRPSSRPTAACGRGRRPAHLPRLLRQAKAMRSAPMRACGALRDVPRPYRAGQPPVPRVPRADQLLPARVPVLFFLREHQNEFAG